jgi:hypothetical protein
MKYLNTKPGSIEELAVNMAKHQNESGYQDMFKKELEKAGKGIGSMTPAEKKAFFNKVDSKYTAKDEETKINEVSERDKRDNLQKIKAINDMVSDLSGTSNSDARKLLDLGKPLNYYINPRGATDAQKKQFIAFASKFSNKMSFRDKREYEGYIKAVTEAVDNPYAVGMAQAMKAKDDQPPLKKSTITKAHDIAKSIEKDQKEEVEIKEEDAYDNDRFIIKNGKATVDNSNTADKKDHVHAPNAKTAVAMYKAGVKSYKDTTDMRKKFPMAVEEVQEGEIPAGLKKYLDKKSSDKKEDIAGDKQNQKQKSVGGEKSFKEVYKRSKKEAMNTTGDATVDNANQNLEPTEKPENDPDVKVAKKKTDVGSKTTGVDTSPEIAYKN